MASMGTVRVIVRHDVNDQLVLDMLDLLKRVVTSYDWTPDEVDAIERRVIDAFAATPQVIAERGGAR